MGKADQGRFLILLPQYDLKVDWTCSPFFQVNLIFPIIYVLCSIFVTLVPMIASPVETGLVVVRFVPPVTLNSFRHWLCHHLHWSPCLLYHCLRWLCQEARVCQEVPRWGRFGKTKRTFSSLFLYDALFPFSFNLCAADYPFNLPKPCSVWNNLAAKVVPGRCHRQNRLKPSRSPWLYLYQGLTDPRPVVKRGIIDVFLRHRDSGSSESSCCSSQRWLNTKTNNSGCDKR